ncbi:MAG: apolipoprotein N-acyltransferase [Ignavibacteriota bacterium]
MKLKRTLLYILSGLCLAFAFPPINIYTLYFPGIVLLIHFIHSSENFKQAFTKSYFALLSFELVTVSWISLSGLREGADKFMILGGFFEMVIHSALLTLPLIIYFYTRKSITGYFKTKNPALGNIISLFTLPFIWVTVEYLYALPEVSFPWLTAGNAFSSALNKIQFIEITGVYGISFWIMTISCFVYIIFEKSINHKDSFGKLIRRKDVIVLLAVVFVLYFIPDLYTIITSPAKKYTNYVSEGKVKVNIIQPNVNPWKKWGAKQIDLVNDYVDLIKLSDTANPKPDLMILPETAVPFYLLDSYYSDKYDLIKSVVEDTKTPLLIGIPDLVYYNDSIKSKSDSKENKGSGKKYDTFNSAVLIQPGEEKVSHQKYAKMRLVIASERMPYQERIAILRDLIRWSVGISSFQIGWDTTIFKLKDKYKFCTAICYETVYPEFFAAFSEKGSTFNVIITNDGWWGKLFGTYQHNQFAILRAIENRRWIARCANTGISGTIDPYGNMYNQSPINEKFIISDYVGINTEVTFYTRHPYLFPNILLLISCVIILGAVVLRIAKKREDWVSSGS